MATRRSRLQIKPNIGGKTSSGPKQRQNNDEKNTTVPISAELAAGAATAINVKSGPGSLTEPPSSSKGSTQGLVSLQCKKGNNTEDIQNNSKDGPNKTVGLTNTIVSDIGSSSSKKDAVTFTRLKRFGLNLGSKSTAISRIDVKSDSQSPPHRSINQSSSPKKNMTRIINSPPGSPVKSHKNNMEILRYDNVLNENEPSKSNSKHVTSAVPNVPVKLNVSSHNLKMPSNTQSKDPGQSPLKSKLVSLEDSAKAVQEENMKNTDSPKPEPEKTNTKLTTKPPSVVQRLPFRSRLPKARPNIDVLRFRNKNLTPGSKEDNTSRPSSPLKPPRAAKFISPLRSPQPIYISTSTEEVEKSQKPEQDCYSPVTNVNKEVILESRKRHLSNSSISTVNSDTQGSFKHNKQKSQKMEQPLDEPLDRNCMKMGDLIYWNPVKNPMVTTVSPKKKVKVDKEKENVSIKENEEDTPEEKAVTVEKEEEVEKDMPVPQVKIGPDGSIILNEESLVIQKEDAELAPEIIEENENTATYASFRKPLSRIGWSEWETEKFYRALSYLGTDFSLMIKLFPNRTRCDIKTKFKREDKLNKNKVDLALKNKKPFDMTFFKQEEELDKLETERKMKEFQEKVKRTKQTRAEKSKEKKKLKEIDKQDARLTRENYRSCRDRQKISYDEDSLDSEITDVELTPDTPVKTPIRFPFRKQDGLPFVPPYCLRRHEDSDEDTLETQVNMSDSEILSPQKASTSEVSQVTESPISLNNTHFPPNSNVQIAHLNDANNSPLVLVYHTPEDGKGETVIHVYQLQNHQLGNVSHVQIPLNDGSSIIELPNLPSSASESMTASTQDQFIVREQSELPLSGQNTLDQENLPFLIATGKDNQPRLVVPSIGENVTENQLSQLQTGTGSEDFINIIDINASKISTPKKNTKGDNSCKEHEQISKGDNSFYEVVRVNSDNDHDSDSSRTSSPSLVIDNECVVHDVDIKYNDNLTEHLNETPEMKNKKLWRKQKR